MFIDPFTHDGEPVQFIQASGFEIELERKRLSDLVLPSGQFIACDPLAAPETEAFAESVPAGTYPVFVLLAHMREAKRPAFVVIETAKTRATKWEVANVTGEEPVIWNDRNRGGFHVETGIAALVDVMGADLILDNVATADGEEEFSRNLRQRLGKTRRGNGMAWAELDFGLRDGTNLIAFEAQDGIYTTYIGRGPDGAVTRIVVDLNVLDFQFTPYGIRLPAMGA